MSSILYDLSDFDKNTGNPPYTNGPITDNERKLFIPFSDNEVATMTIVTSLSSEIKISKLFHLFPITVPKKIREEGKSKIRIIIDRESGPVGSIYSAKYLMFVRGIDRTKSDKIFRNSITIDVETSKKVINAKVSSNTIQMCGASHIDDGKEMADIIIGHIEEIQNMLNYMKENPQLSINAVNFILENTKGEKINRSRETPINDTLTINDNIIDNKCIDLKYDKLPENIDPDIVKFLLKYNEYKNHNEYKEKLEWILKTSAVIENKISIKTINSCMVNINYKLGFNVNRFYMALYLDKQDGMYVKYDNSIMQHVSVEIPCISRLEKTKTNKNKTDYHTIIVYKSGSVTQSGQGGAAMEDAYCRFMRNVIRFKDELIKPEWTIFMSESELDDTIYEYSKDSESYIKADYGRETTTTTTTTTETLDSSDEVECKEEEEYYSGDD